MWGTFLKYGRVFDIYCPNRKSRNGGRFGFVRFLDVKDKRELERQLDQIWVGNRKLWVNYPRYENSQNQNQGGEFRVIQGAHLRSQNRSYAEVVKGQLEEKKEEKTRPLLQNKHSWPEKNSSRSSHLDGSNVNRKIWKEKGLGENWSGIEFNTNSEDEKWLEGCYVGIAHSVEMVRNLQEKFYMEGYFWCRLRAMGGKLVLLDSDDKEELKDLVELAPEWLAQWFESVKLWTPDMVATERFAWIRCQGVPLNAWKSDFFEKMSWPWGKFICLDDSTSKKRRFDIARFLISTPSMNSISITRQVKINGSLFNIKFSEEEFTNNFFSLKEDFMANFQSDSEEPESWSIDSEEEEEIQEALPEEEQPNEEDGETENAENDVANGGVMFNGKVKNKGEQQKEMTAQGGIVISDQIQNLNEEEACVGSEKLMQKHGKAAEVGVTEKAKETLMGQCEQANLKQQSKPIMVGESPEYELSSNMGQPTIKAPARNPKHGKSKIISRTHRSKSGSSDDEEIDLFWKGHEIDEARLQKWMEDRLETKPKKKKKKISLCSTVYRKSAVPDRGKQRTGGRGNISKMQRGERIEPEFIASPNHEIADDSIGDSGIQNCNKLLQKQMRNHLAKEIWELAKQLGVTAENEEEIMRRLEEMENRDRQSKASLVNQDAGDAEKDKTPVNIVNVYSPCSLAGKRALWEDLLNLINSRKGIWCLGGDFNAVRSVEERAGSNGVSKEMEEFDSFIHDAGLVDLPLTGRKYTWLNSNGLYMSRIDRFLFLEDWLMKWGDLRQWGLKRTVSDHCPILIKEEKVDWGPKPFKFFDAWLDQPGCMEMIRKVWNTAEIKGWKGYRLKEKLKITKKALKEWSGNSLPEVDKKINEAEMEIAALDSKGENSHLSTEEVDRRRRCFLQLWDNLKIKESMWQQKSRKIWLKEGDANTKFFHRCVKIRWKKNEINSVQIKGRRCIGVTEIRDQVAQYFEELFAEEKWQRPKLDGIKFKQISEADNTLLTALFNEEEIKSAEFHEQGRLVKGSNSSFIVLIPKVENPQRIEEFRPISLIGVMYKIVAKLLANRLRQVLDRVIGEQQMAFIEGRQLMDGVVIANEVIDEAKKKKMESFLFKADFEKAFDKVCWEFIDYMLSRMGFNVIWRGWIQECLRSSMISVLINGSPTRQFPVGKGIRQGDPLSPFLFLIVAEGLNGLMSTAVEKELYKGVMIGNGATMVSHLQFADDTIFFGEATEDNIRVVKSIMRIFEMASGLKINFGKSQLLGVEVDSDWKVRMACILCCKEGKFPFKYLGVPVGGNHRRLAMWQPLLRSFRKKLSTWKGKHLSIGVRIMLINSVLSSLPVFLMSIYKIPSGIVNSIDKMRRNFLWGGEGEGRKINWVSWERVCKKKEWGGLGVKDMKRFNLALMGKWWGRLASKDEGLWRRVIEGKYSEGRGNWMDWVRDGRGMGSLWWRDVCNLNNRDGENVGWLEEGKDKECYQMGNTQDGTYLLSTGKDKECYQMGNTQDGTWQWNLSWRRTLFEWEKEESMKLQGIIDKVKITPGRPDKWQWIHSSDGHYSTKLAYLKLTEERTGSMEAKMSKRIWNPMLPSKIAAFNWRVILDRIPTKVNLHSRGVIKNMEEAKCSICEEYEDATHLFLNCKLSKWLWKACSRWWGTTVALKEDCCNTFVHFGNEIKDPHIAEGWDCIWNSVIWTIWMARNCKIFQDSEIHMGQLLDLIQLRSFAWIKAKKPRKTRPRITMPILFQLFLCSITGATANQVFYFLGLKYSSATIACALNNVLPAVTFVLAALCRQEDVRIKTAAGQAKVIGTIVCVGGSMLLSFYHGHTIDITESSIHWKYAENMDASSSGNGTTFLGPFLVIVSCVAGAVWFIIQARLGKKFPAPYTTTAVMCFMASIECTVIGFISEHKISEWSLRSGIRLVASLYAGIVCNALAFCLMTWSIEKKGPLYVSVFSPLLLVIVAILSWALLHEKLFVGTLVGSVLIVAGLYAVLWGKEKETKQLKPMEEMESQQDDDLELANKKHFPANVGQN
ncbi:hypothetical protein SLEP1_g5069 [Rubroshorea leprosula]|uniref:Reverse transcriptase domain-containing protein n=1 Tax=Rubroshorea leprosula TaxID=152421 RepID=A0AAV5HYW9_9ROSI|nr:hypothetical protein SLEP1_g5069 [Rubroshorea leprosula]